MEFYGDVDLINSVFRDGSDFKLDGFKNVINDDDLSLIQNPEERDIITTLHDHYLNLRYNNMWHKISENIYRNQQFGTMRSSSIIAIQSSESGSTFKTTINLEYEYTTFILPNAGIIGLTYSFIKIDDTNIIIVSPNVNHTINSFIGLTSNTIGISYITIQYIGDNKWISTELVGDWKEPSESELLMHGGSGSKAIIAGGYSTSSIETYNISVIGAVSTYFGEMTYIGYHLNYTSNGLMGSGVFFHGWGGGFPVRYGCKININSNGENAQYHGYLTQTHGLGGAGSNGVLNTGMVAADHYTNNTLISTFRISTSMVSITFGYLNYARSHLNQLITNGVGNIGLICCGWNGISSIEVVNISKPGNALYFGDVLHQNGWGAACASNSIGNIGVISGSSGSSYIDVLRINSPGNCTIFGSVIGLNLGYPTATSSGTLNRICFNNSKLVKYINPIIQSNSVDFTSLIGNAWAMAGISNG